MPGNLLYYIIVAIVVIAAVAILYAVAQKTGLPIDPFFVRIFWIIVAAVVGILAIKFIAGL